MCIPPQRLHVPFLSSSLCPLPSSISSFSFRRSYSPFFVALLSSGSSFSFHRLPFCPFLLSYQVLTPTSTNQSCPLTTHASGGWDAARCWCRIFVLRRYTAASSFPSQATRRSTVHVPSPLWRNVSRLNVVALWVWVPRHPRTADTKKRVCGLGNTKTKSHNAKPKNTLSFPLSCVATAGGCWFERVKFYLRSKSLEMGNLKDCGVVLVAYVIHLGFVFSY